MFRKIAAFAIAVCLFSVTGCSQGSCGCADKSAHESHTSSSADSGSAANSETTKKAPLTYDDFNW